jgi:hypothetical protein
MDPPSSFLSALYLQEKNLVGSSIRRRKEENKTNGD